MTDMGIIDAGIYLMEQSKRHGIPSRILFEKIPGSRNEFTISWSAGFKRIFVREDYKPTVTVTRTTLENYRSKTPGESIKMDGINKGNLDQALKFVHEGK